MDYEITVLPWRRRLACDEDDDLLTALQSAGIAIESVCGGVGACGKCRVRILEGEVDSPTPQEEDHLQAGQLEQGMRLACQVRPLSDLTVDIPQSSLATGQRLQLDCELEEAALDPAVLSIELEVEVPTAPGDPGSDLARVLGALGEAAPASEALRVDLEGLRAVPDMLRRHGGAVSAVIRGNELLGLLAGGRTPLGVAVDLGSTKIALFLYDLADGCLLSSRGIMNPQVAYGDDIVSRIQFAMENDARRLGNMVVEEVNEALTLMCGEAGRRPGDIFEMVMVGNTAMHHLFLGLPVAQLGKSPYLPATDLPLDVRARDLGLALNRAAVAYLPPPIAGYVGSDHLAAISAARLPGRPQPCLLLDIGTNTEVALYAGGSIRSCSCASGPAFEGGGLSQGMRAGEGAIEDVSIDTESGEPRLSVIGDAVPRGICGSGILSALATMAEMGAVDASGRLVEGARGIGRREEGLAYYLSPPGGPRGEGVAVTQGDVREIQKAKGAIRAGVDALLAEAAVDHSELEEIILAGAFGTFIDPASALRIALLPPVSRERVTQVGNAAGAGARSMLRSLSVRREAEELAGRIEYLELSSYPSLSTLFAAGMYLEEGAVKSAKERFRL